ncbi:MAG: HvfC family RiPP maturation protein, partial [Gammaproteobacteria bacterium]
MNPELRFAVLQRQFAAYIRDPAAEPPPGVAVTRMRVYADLMFRNIESILRNCFPVMHGVLESAHWQELVREFLKRHRARTPLFPWIPREFVTFIETARRHPDDPDYLLELGYYEWLELE